MIMNQMNNRKEYKSLAQKDRLRVKIQSWDVRVGANLKFKINNYTVSPYLR